MQESGIDMEFDTALENDVIIESNENYYELQSKPVVVTSVPAEVKHVTGGSRTNLRQQLMKQQQAQLEMNVSTSGMISQLPPASYTPLRCLDNARQTSSAVPVTQSSMVSVPKSPMQLHSTSGGDPNQGQQLAQSIPAKILEVKSGLLHPTKYHVSQQQKQQVNSYLNEHNQHQLLNNEYMHSAPTTLEATICMPSPSPSFSLNGSLTTPDISQLSCQSPLSLAGTNSEVDDLLGDIISLESVDAASELGLLDRLPHTHTDGMLLGNNGELLTNEIIANATSCPQLGLPSKEGYRGGRVREDHPPVTLEPQEKVIWAKERVKKDNHNMIERRRRFNINDRIKELGTLLPKFTDPEMRQNKGSILKATVDYVRQLQKDQNLLRSMEHRQIIMDANNKKMFLRMQELEMKMKTYDLNCAVPATSSSSSPMLGRLPQPLISNQQPAGHHLDSPLPPTPPSSSTPTSFNLGSTSSSHVEAGLEAADELIANDADMFGSAFDDLDSADTAMLDISDPMLANFT